MSTNQKFPTRNPLALLALIVASQSILGCSGVGVKNSMRPTPTGTSQWSQLSRSYSSKNESSLFNKNKKPAPPESMVVLWKDSVLEKPGLPSVRGFGGRIYFYDNDAMPVKVNGELVVYGFDDSESSELAATKTPTKRFVFTQDQFQTHFSETDLGPSYSVWIPWEKMGGYRKTIALFPVFVTEDGQTLKGGSSINILPGLLTTADQELLVGPKKQKGTNASNVSQAGFNQSQDDASSVGRATMSEAGQDPGRIRSSTINLTPTMAEHFRSKSGASGSSEGPTLVPNAVSSASTERHTTGGSAPNPQATSFEPNNQATASGLAPERTAQAEFVPHTNRANDPSVRTQPEPRPAFGAPGTYRR